MAKKNVVQETAPVAVPEQDTVLEYIKEQTDKNGFAYVDAGHEAVQKHLAAGTIELNHEVKNEHGHIAARIATAPVEAAPVAAKPAKQVYAISADVPLIPAKRGVTKEEDYPFSQLEIEQNFFVPVSEDHKEPWKTFPSTVSSATRRFSTAHPEKTRVDKNGLTVPVLVPTRKFTLRRVTAGQKYSNGFVEPADGVRVFRVALKEKAE